MLDSIDPLTCEHSYNHGEKHPNSRWCFHCGTAKVVVERIALLEAVAEAANSVDLDCEEVENNDGMMMLVPIDVMHKLSDALDALRAAGYLGESDE
jgi:hypothetical protein